MTSKYELEKLINFVICVNKQFMGGGFRPIILETLIMRYGLKGKGRTRPDFLGWFWVHAHNFTHVRPRSKKFWPK